MDRRQGETPSSPVLGTVTSLVIVALVLLFNFLPLPDGPIKLLFIPYLVLVPVYFLTLRRQQGVGPVGAFVTGLAIDILTFGPLGITAASFTLVHLLLRHEREALMALPTIFKMGLFALAVGFVLLVACLSLEFLGPGAPAYHQVGIVLGAIWIVGIVFDTINSAIGQSPQGRGGRGMSPTGLSGRARHKRDRKGKTLLGKSVASSPRLRRKGGRRFGWLMRQS